MYFEFHEQGGKQAVIKDGWKLLHLQVNNPQKEHYELYNLNADPGENANVLNQYPQKVQELEKIMKKREQPMKIGSSPLRNNTLIYLI